MTKKTIDPGWFASRWGGAMERIGADLSNIMKECLAVTAKERDRRAKAEKEPPTPRFTDKAKRLADLAEKIGGCQKTALFGLVEEITGEKLPPAKDTKKEAADARWPLPKYLVVVPTGNENSHNYALRRTCVSTGAERFCIRKDGRPGNHMGNRFRIATDAEIRGFFDSLSFESAGRVVENLRLPAKKRGGLT